MPFGKLPEEAARPAAARPRAAHRRADGRGRRAPPATEPHQGAAQERSLRRGLRGPAARTCGGASSGARGASARRSSRIARCAPAPTATATACAPRAGPCRVKGRTIAEYVSLPISDALRVFEGFQFTERENLIAGRLLREIRDRLKFLDDVGVGYLTLGRSAATLSGGEGQRIRLATQIGANLTGVLYVLDEPSIGLHQRDNRRLLATLVPAARSGQQRHRRRARRGDDPHRRLRRSTSARAPASTAAS